MVEKYALLVGGCATHRLDLSNMVMLKDNHIWSAGSITGAVELAKKAAGFSSKIEVECRSLEEGHEAAAAGADIIMLDNMKPVELKLSAAMLKASHPSVLIEASGGITTESMHNYFSPHVDIISRGNLTQGYSCLDFSLKIQQGGAPSEVGTSMTAGTSMGFEAESKPKRQYRKKRILRMLPQRQVVPGAYQCIKGPAVAYRTSMNLDARDEETTPVKLGDQVKGCVECAASEGAGASWLETTPEGCDGVRYLPTFVNGEALFEPVLEPKATIVKKPYEVPEMQKYYTVFATLTRAEVKASMPTLERGHVNKELGKRWRELSDEQKRSYTEDLLEDYSNKRKADALDGAEDDDDEAADTEAVPEAPVVQM